MTDQTKTTHQGTFPLDRRGFVGVAGAAAVATAVPLLTAAPSEAAALRTTLPVGVLVPSHLSHASAGAHLVAGLRLGFRGAGVRAHLSLEEVDRGYGGVTDAALRLIDGGARVLVAGVALPIAERLAPLCREGGVALVAAGVGAHVVTERLPGVVHCTQQHWQASFVMGGWAARHLGHDLFQVIAAPDAGYDSVYALRRGFQASGGRIAGSALTHDRAAGTGAAEAALAARLSGARTVAVHASGRRAVEIVRAIRAAGTDADLVVDGLGVEDFALHDLGRGSGGIYSASAWCRADATAFSREFRAATGQVADPFAAVGHDAAVLVAVGGRRLALNGRQWGGLAGALAGVAVQGVRGKMTVDPETRSATVPLVVRRVRAGRNTVVARRPAVKGTPPSLAVLERVGVAAYVNELLGT